MPAPKATITRAEFDARVRQSGLQLNETQRSEFFEVYGYIEAMAARVRAGGNRRREAEPAIVFKPNSLRERPMTGIPTIASAAADIASGRLSPVALAESCLARIDRHEAKLKSFIRLERESALASARTAEAEIKAGRRRGPLHGIPFAHKDIYETAGIPTTCHSKLLQDYVPTKDAFTVAKLADAGIVMLGKLATHEFAVGGPSFDLPWPVARNPWATEYFTGGSSSGTGAAVAAGFVLGGTGSCTGGSIRTTIRILRARWHQADLWLGQPIRDTAAGIHARPRRSLGMDGGRLCHSLAGNGRP